MQRWGFLVLRTGVEWWVAVLNSMPPTGTKLHAKSSGASQKTQLKKGGGHCESKRESVCIQKGLGGKAGKEMGTFVSISEP